MDGTVGISAALHPFLEKRPGSARNLAAILEEELVSFFARRGEPVEEMAGRRMALLPAGQLDPGLAWSFVADHLITRVSHPVEELARIGRLFARALRDAGARGAMDPERARLCAHAAELAVAELPRLDQIAHGLRALVAAGRPGPELYESDPEAYARAMQRWEAEQPVALEELQGGFAVDAVEGETVRLYHPRREEPLELHLPASIARQVREGDRLDVQLGRSREGWFLMDAWAAAAPGPRIP